MISTQKWSGKRPARRSQLLHFSRNARAIWSASGRVRYDITVRSPVLTKASTGMPGTSLTLPSSPPRKVSQGS
jgi:hypothetical protein